VGEWKNACAIRGGAEAELCPKNGSFSFFFFLDFPLDLSLPPTQIPIGASSASAIL